MTLDNILYGLTAFCFSHKPYWQQEKLVSTSQNKRKFWKAVWKSWPYYCHAQVQNWKLLSFELRTIYCP